MSSNPEVDSAGCPEGTAGLSPGLVLDGGIDCEKTGGPTKQVERRGRTKSGPLDPMRFEHEHDDEHEDDLVAATTLCCTLARGLNRGTLRIWTGNEQSIGTQRVVGKSSH
jgi:hypothetical protein